MVMEPPSAQSVGREFVRQYYTLLNKAPLHLHRFYSSNSSFIHGGLDADDQKSSPVHGQYEIHKKIMQLNFRDCHTKVRQVDAHATFDAGVVVQVSGELSNNGLPMRRFMQTFVLAPQSPMKYYVHNDIFRYQDEVFSDENETGVETSPSNTIVGTTVISTSTDSGLLSQSDSQSGSQVVSEHVTSAATVNSAKMTVDKPPTVIANDVRKFEPTSDVSDHHPRQNRTAVANNTTPKPAASTINHKPASVQNNQKNGTNNGGFAYRQNSNNSDRRSHPVVINHEDKKVEPERNEATITIETLIKNDEPPVVEEDVAKDENPPNAPLSVVSDEPRTYANRVKSGGDHQGSPSRSGTKQLSTEISTSRGSNQSNNDQPMWNPTGKERFRGGSARGGGAGPYGGGVRGGPVNNSGHYRDRYNNNSTSPLPSSVTDGPNVNGVASEIPTSSNRRSMPGASHTDLYQLFVGNLPLNCSESNLYDLFERFGKVADIRIHKATSSRSMPSGGRPPNYGFIIFEDERVVDEVLKNLPIFLPWEKGEHRLNVEEKKKIDGGMGRHSLGGGGRNYDKGSQEHVGMDRKSGGQSGWERSRGGMRGGRGRDEGRSGGRGGSYQGAERRGGNYQQRGLNNSVPSSVGNASSNRRS